MGSRTGDMFLFACLFDALHCSYVCSLLRWYVPTCASMEKSAPVSHSLSLSLSRGIARDVAVHGAIIILKYSSQCVERVNTLARVCLCVCVRLCVL